MHGAGRADLVRTFSLLLLIAAAAGGNGTCDPGKDPPKCVEGQVYDATLDVCVPGCRDDDGCPAGWTCADVACYGDADCLDQCLPPGGKCHTDLDCAAPYADPCEGAHVCEGYVCELDPSQALVCDDGAWCNGEETCAGGVCVAGAPQCPGRVCD